MCFILFPVHGPIRHVEAPRCHTDWRGVKPFEPSLESALGCIGLRWWAFAKGTEPNPHAARLGVPHACGDILVTWDFGMGDGHCCARPGDEALILDAIGKVWG